MRETYHELEQRLKQLNPKNLDHHVLAAKILKKLRRIERKAKQQMNLPTWVEHVRYQQEQARERSSH